MKKQITRVSPVQAGKVAAVLYLLLSIPFIVILFLVTMFQGQSMGVSGIMLVVIPVLYGLFGFIFTIIGAAIYNFVAGLVGGLEFTVREVDAA